MKIRGRYGKGGLGYINCHVICREPLFTTPIRFVVDTGASSTIIADKDALRLGLDYSKLQQSEGILGIGGADVEAFLLKGVSIIFRDSKSSYHVERLDKIRVLRHYARDVKQRRLMRRIPSLLGVDILKKYQIRYDKDGVIIEK